MKNTNQNRSLVTTPIYCSLLRIAKLVGARMAELERQKTALLKMESALNDLEALAIGAKREHLTRDNLAATMHARIQTCRAALAMARGK